MPTRLHFYVASPLFPSVRASRVPVWGCPFDEPPPRLRGLEVEELGRPTA